MYEGKAVEDEEEEELRRKREVKTGERWQITEPTEIKVKEGKKKTKPTLRFGSAVNLTSCGCRVRRQLLVQ